MFLSGGGVYAHADPRRTSVAGQQGWQRQWDGAPHAGTNADLVKFVHAVHAALEPGCRVPAPAPVLPANTPPPCCPGAAAAIDFAAGAGLQGVILNTLALQVRQTDRLWA